MSDVLTRCIAFLFLAVCLFYFNFTYLCKKNVLNHQ